MANKEKIREIRLRNTAKRRGFELSKSRRRDPLAVDYGIWTVLDAKGKAVAKLPDLDAVESYLDGGK
jgi:hypothetical protein